MGVRKPTANKEREGKEGRYRLSEISVNLSTKDVEVIGRSAVYSFKQNKKHM